MTQHPFDWQSFKRNINLIDFAKSEGYEVEKKKSTIHSVCLSHRNGDKIIVSKKNGIWVYFSVFDDSDNGTIIDFIQHKIQKSYTEIFNFLRNWKGFSGKNNYELEDTPPHDQIRIQRVFHKCILLRNHEYLNQRGLNKELLNSERFKGSIFRDRFDNVVFPHCKERKISALELKNSEIHVFVKGSEKTFWQSNRLENDDHLYIAETPIDALSYQALFSLKDAFYIATSGSPSKNQILSILKIINDFDKVTFIGDNDEGGDKLFNRLKKAIQENGMKSIIKRHSPEQYGYDWNDVLVNS